MKYSYPFNPFKWVDTHGIPLEIIVKAAQERGIASDFTVLLFADGAARAGWKKPKILSDIRELKNFDLKIPKWFDVCQEHS